LRRPCGNDWLRLYPYTQPVTAWMFGRFLTLLLLVLKFRPTRLTPSWLSEDFHVWGRDIASPDRMPPGVACDS